VRIAVSVRIADFWRLDTLPSVKARPVQKRGAFALMILAIGLFTVRAEASKVTDVFIEAVAQLESSGGRKTVGDRGRARGTWQMHRAAWLDVTKLRRSRGQATWPYSESHDSLVARAYARDYLRWMETRIEEATGRPATAEQIYAAYNVGFSRFRQLQFRVERAPATTRLACARIGPLVAALSQHASNQVAQAPAR
jgi:hypothetical protein